MHEGKANSSQLIIFDDGTLYHIDLKKSDNIPPNILLVGASDRVDLISTHFDKITFQHRNKARPEFYTVTGTYKGVPVAAMSLGIGVGPVDIAVNELHALFEYDHISDSWTKQTPKINIIRVGTCGTSLPDINAGTFAISNYAIGLDNLGAYYPTARNPQSMEKTIECELLKTKVGAVNPCSYCSKASPLVIDALLRSAVSRGAIFSGITTASPGFFGPEGRQIGRIKTAFGPDEFRNIIQSFEVQGQKIINHEMETSILFRLGYEHLGYNVGAICLVVDNLATNEVISSDEACDCMNSCIKIALDALKILS
ncbi:MAG: hypothetical protein A3I26_00070 [Candidatus Yanofskybacteria bacterium RIFCSPLOWO2_02_FULL_43_10]|uniref:Nucleoside phosphorylase domain-containing protein n=1 Tax=Candidatus Yanofskybacteria bacterium RIFCSPLOWO2_12_FULL_43_11b TaxID=1802710 RepID=A0A1F8H8R9_9BACT|nr:MAG: hypothetical protein A2742_03425 [Candidatus Yanofskybacteria bacterium RIFCSPHIGHO2_01_FULL_43_32]OGN12138.1 MAG: hypothetical protein A3C69_02210 [Candidatus Yanofskybacteria bacterium RIFCSPHIGHO2_02_FULL_43_12]OGN18252.1 MAG: hypothetical protein A3E34_02485 [Candidatus Yanofskybacteria bacterium RIFCSPHIGHO2_12_FULL_43_11]OGN25213.1 MAG: hypothetical protein A2923_00550 [Candidatus Yanofskybacteria bacterium RIFCSPLOWO2_01_FULL_43_46]OGN29271.1 MAG: hypothetical protein A3I26_00070